MKQSRKVFFSLLASLFLASCQSPELIENGSYFTSRENESNSYVNPIDSSEVPAIEDDGGPITVYLWSNAIYPSFAKHIQTSLSDIDIQFVVGNNDLDFYRFMNENGKLPDIITCRRFSLRDAAPISGQLMDLSDTSAAGSIYDSYLKNFTNKDGTIQWLPVVGEVDGIVINKKLFSQYQIPIPTDYKSFVSACDKFEEHGIRGFAGDYTYDYTCMGVLQGMSIPALTSLKGLQWRSSYEDPSATRPGLDTEIWPKAFETMEQFLKDTHTKESDTELKYSTLANAFTAGQVAMVRAGGSNVVGYSGDNYPTVDPMFLPYFSPDGGEWLLTYPAFQIALNKNLSKNSARKAKALRILNTMLSDGAQKTIAVSGEVITYSRNSTLKLHESLESIRPLIEKNHLFIRVASNDFFSASRTVVHKMIKGKATPKEAYEEFNAILTAPAPEEGKPILTIEKGYDYVFDEIWGGNRSASAMANTLRKAYGVDVLIATSHSFTGLTFAGSYPKNQVGYMIMPNALDAYRVELSGAELRRHLAWVISGTELTIRPFNKGVLPTVSGMSIEVNEENGVYQFKDVLINGKPVSDDAKYTLITLNPASYMGSVMPREGLTWAKESTRVRNYWVNMVETAHNQGGNFVLEDPTPNIRINHIPESVSAKS